MRLAVAATAFAILTACAPPPLTEPADAGGSSPDVAAGPDGSNSVPFTEVATIMRNDCSGSGNCHGPGDFGGLHIEGGSEASDENVRAAIDGTTVDGEEAKFIVPEKPQESVLYQTLLKLNDRPQMPLDGRLADEKIEKIRVWIAQGASYE